MILDPSSSDKVVARNLASATWTLAQGAGIGGAGRASRFVNLGFLQQTGADSTSTIDAKFYSYGTLDVEGVLNLTGRVTYLSGAITGAGEVVGGDTVLDSTTLSCGDLSLGNVRLVGDVTASTRLSFDDVFLDGATLTFDGDAGTLSISGKIDGAGVVDNRGAADLTGSYDIFTKRFVSIDLDDKIIVTNEGELTTNSGFSFSGTTGTGASNQISNLAGAVWDDNGGVYADGGGNEAGFDNAGTFEEFKAGGLYTAFVNEGVVLLGPSYDPVAALGFTAFPQLTLSGPVTGSGAVDVSSGNIVINGSVAATQTVAFTAASGAAPTLTLDDVLDFAATITGFDQNGATDDQIVVGDWTFQDFAADAGGTGGELMFTNGAAIASVDLLGRYAPTSFHAAVSGSQTTITYTAPA